VRQQYRRGLDRRTFLHTMAAAAVPVVRPFQQLAPVGPGPGGIELDAVAGTWHVRPGASIQQALDAAAADGRHKRVVVHAGTYRPAERGQALVWFNRRHDGIVLEAEGEVELTAANPDVADRRAPSFPAIVNHVVYFGDGITSSTVLRGFRITGANGFTMGTGQSSPIESDDVRKTLYFFADGGGIKIYARSYPTIENVQIVDNYASPCAGGVSVEHLGQNAEAAVFRNCIFRGNRTQVTGAALDILHGSAAIVENCLFTANVSNMGVDYVGILTGGEIHPEHGSGALTVFQGSRVSVRRCTFTGNWNGVDDIGTGSIYEDSIFWQNTLTGGISPGSRYEFDITDASGVRGNFIGGTLADRRGTIDRAANTFDPPDPGFDSAIVPRNPAYANVGYRPHLA
jgi:hypothetical protein